MIRTTLAGLRAHKLRLVASALAIVLGVGFVAGILVFNDTAKAALLDEFARAAKNVDLAVQPPPDTELPLSTVDTLRAVPGVSAVDGRMRAELPLLDRRGRLVGNGGEPGVAISAGTVPALRGYDVQAGQVPSGPTEAALDADTVARTGYRLGDTVTVLDRQQVRQPLTLVGIVGFGTSKQFAGQAVVVLSPDAMTRLTGVTGYREVVATAVAGTPVTALVARAGSVLPAARISTGDAYRDDLANDAISQLTAFRTVLLVFAVIACVVSAFVIYNTFTILMAQRVRELALLRCVGARRGQIFTSVLLESTVVGLIGAGLGLGLGIGVGYGLFSGVGVGGPLPSHAVVLTAVPIVAAFTIGVLVTVASAVIPAVRATRVSPLAALRAGPSTMGPRTRRRMLLIVPAGLAGGVGTGLSIVGSTAHGDAEFDTLLVVAGGLANFLAVLIVSPLFVGPFTAALGALPGRWFGSPVRLAVANARRNPGRTAATTATLMIGLGLMSAATVSLSTVRATASDQLTQHYPFDYVVTPSRSTPTIPTVVAERLRAQPGLGLVAEVRTSKATVDGRDIVLGSLSDATVARQALPLTTGSVQDFRSGSVILYASAPAAQGKHVGDTVSVSTSDGHRGTYLVVGLVAGRSQTGDAVLTWEDFAHLVPAAVDDSVLIRAAGGVNPVDSRAAVESVTDDYPLVTVQSLAEWRAQITQSVDTLIAVVGALLAVAIIIALIGIMNTLSLSILERTRESALTRALGLTRGQLRATLLAEALLMGLVGSAVGIAFGLLYGWATVRVIFTGFAPVVSIPVGPLSAYLAAAGVAAVLAAVLPARTAARASIVSAMAES